MSQPESLWYLAPSADYQRLADGLLTALQSGEEDAAWRFKWVHPRFRGQSVADVKAATLGLDDARLVIARDYGFEGWPELEGYTAAVQYGPVRRFETAVEAVVAGDLETLRSLLREHPMLVRARSTRRHHASLLHYIAANGVENCRQRTPPNAVEVAKTLLDAGAEVDALADMYDHKCTTMSMLVSSCHPANAGLQVELAETLLDFGGALNGPGSNWQSAAMTALTFGYLDTARALVRRGSPVDNLPLAAGVGLLNEAERLLPTADPKSRHVALALAAQHGHADVVRLLLNSGEDPNRFNPDGYHSHSTPLHQAALAGHIAAVQELVEHGARLDVRDTIYDGTPLGWAEHGSQTAVAEFLNAQVDSREQAPAPRSPRPIDHRVEIGPR
jgi:ankyrin repeat protein